MINLGIKNCCKVCLKSIIDNFGYHQVKISIVNSTMKNRCEIETGILGGRCENPSQFIVKIEELNK